MHHQHSHSQPQRQPPFLMHVAVKLSFQIEFQLQKVQYFSRSFQHPSFLHVSTRKNSKTRPRLIVNRKISKELAAKRKRNFQ